MVVFYYEPNEVRYISMINENTTPLGSAQLTVVREHERALSPELEAASSG